MKSFKRFLIEKIDLSDVIIDSREIVEKIIIGHSRKILSNLAAKIDSSSKDYNQKVISSWEKYIGYGVVSAVYLRDIKKYLEANLIKHTQEMFPKIKSLNTTIGFRDNKVKGVGGSFSPDYTAIYLKFDYEKLADFIKTDVASSISETGNIEYSEFKTTKLENFVKGMISTYCHEVEHYFQYLSKQSENRDYTFSQKSYLSKNKKFVETIGKEAKSWTKDEWAIYLGNPIEIDANAVGVAAKIIQEVNKQYANDPEMQIDELKWILGSLKYNFEHEETLKLYSVVIRDKADDKRYAKVWKRFIKKIYEKVVARIEKLKEVKE